MARAIRIPVHGFVELADVEWAVVNSRPFQRLRDIRQLGMGHMVYPGANHTRFEHSIGVVHVASSMFDRVRDALKGEFHLSDADCDRYRRLLRLAALLHDIGHGPFSHSAEDLFEVPEGHASASFTHEDMTAVILLQDPVAGFLKAADLDPAEVVSVATGKASRTSTAVNLLLSDLLTGELGADRLDYLLRDAHHSGQPAGHVDLPRLLLCLQVVEEHGALYPGFSRGAITVAEQVIANRYAAYTSLYFHKTKRAYELHLVCFLRESIKRIPCKISPFLRLTDSFVQDRLASASDDVRAPGHEHAAAIAARQHWRLSQELLPSDERRERLDGADLPKRLGERFGDRVWIDSLSHSATKMRGKGANRIRIAVEKNAVRGLDEVSEIVRGMEPKIWRLRVYSAPEIRHADVASVIDRSLAEVTSK